MTNQPDTTGRGRRFLIYHLPAIAYALGIIALSSTAYLRTPNIRFLAVDKLAHFVEYAVFTLLAFRSIYHLGSKPNLRRSLLWSALFVSLFALSDEVHQHFVPGRHSDWRDFVVDVAGAFLVLVILGIYRQRRRRRVY